MLFFFFFFCCCCCCCVFSRAAMADNAAAAAAPVSAPCAWCWHFATPPSFGGHLVHGHGGVGVPVQCSCSSSLSFSFLSFLSFFFSFHFFALSCLLFLFFLPCFLAVFVFSPDVSFQFAWQAAPLACILPLSRVYGVLVCHLLVDILGFLLSFLFTSFLFSVSSFFSFFLLTFILLSSSPCFSNRRPSRTRGRARWRPCGS